MKVRDVMTTPAITVGPDTPFAEIVDRLLSNDISGLPVVDDDGRLVGIVTEADLVSKEAYDHRRRRALGLVADYLRGRDPQWVRKAAGQTAADLMTAAPATASHEEGLAAASRRLLEEHHKRLPVVDDGRIARRVCGGRHPAGHRPVAERRPLPRGRGNARAGCGRCRESPRGPRSRTARGRTPHTAAAVAALGSDPGVEINNLLIGAEVMTA